MQSEPGPDVAKHGRACENCSRAKAKCIPRTGTDAAKCTRCFRLKKQCTVPAPKPRKKRARMPAGAAQLEQKIESLVTLLSAAQGSPATLRSPPENQVYLEPPPAKLGPASAGCTPVWSDGIPQDKQWGVPGPSHHSASTHVATPALTPVASSTAGSSITADFDSQDESERLVRIFRDQFAPNIAFSVISHDDTAHELRLERPHLLKTILLIANQEGRGKQIELGTQFARETAEAMIVNSEKSLDMLQAMLVYSSWAYSFSPASPNAQSTTHYLLCNALLFDLGLHRSVRPDENGPTDVDRWTLGDNTSKERKRTIDERRALLYCFLLTSVSAHCVKRFDGLHSSPYIESSCQALLAAEQSDSDKILVITVRFQCLVESIQHIAGSTIVESQASKAPLWMHVAPTRAELQSIWESVPPSLKRNTTLQLHYHSTEIFLYDSSCCKHLFQPGSASNRLDMLYACLLATKSYLDIFLAEPLSSYIGFSAIQLSQFAHALSTLIKLTFAEEIGWDLAHVRESANVRGYYTHFTSHMERAGAALDAAHPPPARISFATGCSRALRRVLAQYEAKLVESSAPPVAFPQGQPQGPPLDDMLWGGSLEGLNDAFWELVAGDFMQP